MRHRNWEKTELILALNLYLKVPFSKINYRLPQIIELAFLINRSPSAVALKLVNFARLDPTLQKRKISGMSHGSKKDQEIWNKYWGNWEMLFYESEKVLAKLKKQYLEDIFSFEKIPIPKEAEEKKSYVKVRINQQSFRSCILASYNNTCCITGIQIPELLIASHIIPWSEDKLNRCNPSNGLCLNSLHDKAFDKGFITVTPDYKIKISKSLKENKNDLINKYFNSFDNKEIILPQRFLPDKSFLKFHNQHKFLK